MGEERGKKRKTSYDFIPCCFVFFFFFEFKIMINNEKRIGVQLESLFFYLKYSLI